MLRKLSNAELADLPAWWQNSWLDQSKYYTSVIEAWQTDKKTYERVKADGCLSQEYRGRYYIA